MGAEDFKRGVVSVLLAFALVFSMISVAPPASPGELIIDPGGTTIEVVAGENFLIRHVLEWNEPENGAYTIWLGWVNYENKPSENLTFVSAEAYFTTGANVGESILAEVTELSSAPSGADTAWVLAVSCPADNKDPRDGEFNVDIWMGAYGAGGVPHISGDHVIPWHFGGVIVVEKYPQSWNRDPITIRVVIAPPRLLTPLDGILTNDNIPTFEWENTSVYDNYEIWVDNDPDFSSPMPGFPDNTTDNFYAIAAPGLADENYSWKVRAYSGAYVSGFSETWTFLIDSIPPAQPTLVWPADSENINDNTPNLDWENVPEESLPVTYDVWVDDDSDFSSPIENASGITDDNYQVTTELAEGVWYWRVRAVDNTGNVGDNSQRSFRVDITPPGKPTLVSPESDATEKVLTVTFTWSSVTDISAPVTYHIQIDNEASFTWPYEHESTGLIENSYNYTFSVDDNYYWWVRARDNAGNYGEWADNFKLTIARAAEIAPPFHIVGNDNFTPANGVTSGSGTENDPYIIENWDINAENAHGIWIENTDAYFIIRNCYIHGGKDRNVEGGYDGIFFDNVINGIVDNNVTANNRIGINIYYSSNNLISNNLVENNTYGIYLNWYSDNNLLSNNLVENNDDNGIYLYRSDNNLISNNLVENNSRGGILCISDNNLIYHNNLMNNGWFQASDHGSNYWDNGYLSGGNYWGDYTDMDENRGENQDIPGSDGIGDTPYIIPGGNNRDRYPLMNPWPSIRIVVDLTISPSYASGLPGGTLSYTVTITNMGNVVDNYDLTVSDNSGWVLKLSENRFENVMPGGENRTTLTVTIPENATPCTRDNVTVVVTSQENFDISDNGISIAHAGRLDVEVSISPFSQDNRPGGKLEYMVEVKNIGDVIDNYKLTVDDDTNWDLTLDDNLLENILPDENRTITLSVTIPDDAENCTLDNIIVTVVSQENENVSDNANCIAHALIIYGVEVLVSPHSQETENGGTLTYTVTVANTGNVPDTYTLEKADTMDWPLSLEDASLEVPENESRTTTLTVTIPVDATGCTDDTVTVTATSTENTAVSDSDNCIAHVTVVKDVEVSISPPEDSGAPGETLTYTVKVTNKGNVEDSYNLEASDNADPSWDPTVPPTPLTIPPNDNKTATLSVIIPEGTAGGTEDEITVKATSGTDSTVSDIATCIARAVVERGVEVSILTPEDSGPPGETLTFTVTVTNTGSVEDNYKLAASDNADWSPKPSVSPTSLSVPIGESRTATLTVIIPDVRDVSPGEEDEITVTATSTENAEISGNATCIARAVIVRGVEVSIPSPENSGIPGENVTFTVIIINTGNVMDSYSLGASDNAVPSWAPMVSPTPLGILAGDNRTATLSVIIPEGTASGMEDNITVTATSLFDNTVSDNATCIATAATMRDVEVSISPPENSGAPGETLTFTVTVKNMGNVSDNYDLTVSDNAVPSWAPSLSDNLLENVGLSENKTATITVKIPDDAENSTRDNVTVTVTSRADNTVKDSASCTAHAVAAAPPLPPERGVQVSISPSSDSGLPGETLTFTVTVKNTGNVDDNYNLTVSDDADWVATLDKNLLTIPAHGNRTTKLRVTIPNEASSGEEYEITVTATSVENENVSDSVTPRAIVAGAPEEPGVELPIPLAISVFLIGAAILVPAYLLRRRPKKARGRVLRDVGFGFRGRPKKAARRRVLRDVSSGFR